MPLMNLAPLKHSFPILRTSLVLALAALVAVGCTGPRTKRLSKAKYEKVPKDQDIEVYVSDAGGEKLAVIESDAFAYVDEAVKRRQLDQLTAKARSLGGNAVEHVRILTKEVQGYTPDERVPFTAWKQGRYELYFMRAEATRRPELEPANLDEARPKGGWVVETLDQPRPLKFDITQIPMPRSEEAGVVLPEASAPASTQGRFSTID